MGQGTPGGMGRQGLPGDRKQDGEKKEKKFEPAAPPSRVGRRQRKQKGPEAAARLPAVTPLTKCKLRLLKLERIKDYLLMEEEFVASQERLKPHEDKNEEDRSKVDDLRGSPMSVGNLEELIDENHAIVSSSVGPEYYVSILSFVDKDQLEPGCAILMHNKVLSVVGLLQDEVDPMVSVMKVEKAPLESYADIGGLDAQIQEIKEAVELPLTHPELYEDIGIKPPKGVILYGEPGTGKTLLAKAVANSTSATFLRVVGSELIQKYLGDGPKLVRELFRVADDLSPSIVFIDEIDAVGTKRYDAHSGGEREIQRTMLELLNQLDGFDSRGDVKVILATNKIESLDPALLRPGRIDRKIEFPLPDIKTRRRIFQIHTSRMTLAEDVNLEEFVMTKDEFSGADIKAICTEAGLLALRERRMKVTHVDFKKAKEKVMFKKKEGVPEGLYINMAVIPEDDPFYSLHLLANAACDVQESERRQEAAERQRKQRKRRRTTTNDQRTKKIQKFSWQKPIQSPEWLRPYIQRKEVSEPVFLFSKVLTQSDTMKQQSRLLLVQQAAMKVASQLNDVEKSLVEKQQLAVKVFDMEGREHPMEYKKYKSGAHRLISGWTEFYETLGLKPFVHYIEVWSFRVFIDAENGEEEGLGERKTQFCLAIQYGDV
ncbi:hypothetical protein J5N97_026799 [Dioscorea zingiberensis]|uniref:AAA+ ATPase domain-containing protein n=1 Tax=Dioscorea zingiberensis TaxID=325984 RepID=A0A9D5C309_9LILI|nr:hypothetical protein J5N97_026799 [Dioscorea zingiberensis]